MHFLQIMSVFFASKIRHALDKYVNKTYILSRHSGIAKRRKIRFQNRLIVNIFLIIYNLFIFALGSFPIFLFRLLHFLGLAFIIYNEI